MKASSLTVSFLGSFNSVIFVIIGSLGVSIFLITGFSWTIFCVSVFSDVVFVSSFSLLGIDGVVGTEVSIILVIFGTGIFKIDVGSEEFSSMIFFTILGISSALLSLMFSFVISFNFGASLSSLSTSNESIIIGTIPSFFLASFLIVGNSGFSLICSSFFKSVDLLIFFISTSDTLFFSSKVFSSWINGDSSIVGISGLSCVVLIFIFNSGISFSIFSGTFGCSTFVGVGALDFGNWYKFDSGTLFSTFSTCFLGIACSAEIGVGVIFGLATTNFFFLASFCGPGFDITWSIFLSFSSVFLISYSSFAASAWIFACSGVNKVTGLSIFFSCFLIASAWAFLVANASAWALACSGVKNTACGTWALAGVCWTGGTCGFCICVVCGIGCPGWTCCGCWFGIGWTGWACWGCVADLALGAGGVGRFFVNSLISFISTPFSLNLGVSTLGCCVASTLFDSSDFNGSTTVVDCFCGVVIFPSKSSSPVAAGWFCLSSSSSSRDLVRYAVSSSGSLSSSMTRYTSSKLVKPEIALPKASCNILIVFPLYTISDNSSFFSFVLAIAFLITSSSSSTSWIAIRPL